jgi:hypothetical protein
MECLKLLSITMARYDKIQNTAKKIQEYEKMITQIAQLASASHRQLYLNRLVLVSKI